MEVTGADIVREARANIGTPYRFRGRTRGRGLDCVGNVHVAAKEAGAPIAAPSRYRPENPPEMVLREVRRVLGDPCPDLAPGMVAVLRSGRRHFHLGIFTGPGLVEADDSPAVGRVVETRIHLGRLNCALLGAWLIPGVVL